MLREFMSGPSIGVRSVETGGRSTGFDYLRLLLAVSVIAWHAFGVSYGASYYAKVLSSPIRPAITAILPMFFALSGFLVAGSLYRTAAISTFVGLRFLRIFPALAVEVMLSALVLGPVLTDYSLSSYFGDPLFAHYFLNIVGEIQYQLPGLFEDNPIRGVVNSQLWTVPRELACYITLTGLAIVGITKRRTVFIAIVAGMIVGFYIYKIHSVRNHLAFGLGVPGVVLVFSFLSAIVVYQFRDKIPWNPYFAVVATILMVVCLGDPNLEYFVEIPAAYLTVFLGLLNPRKLSILRGADYSYGLYLYGFVIQQSISEIGDWTHHWYVNFVIAMVFASAFAAFSWHFIEKPTLGLKKYLPEMELFIGKLNAAIFRVRHQGS